MFKSKSGLLKSLSDEIAALAEQTVPSTAIVTGQGHDFSSSSGSAWLLDAQHLVTNHHVIEGLVEPIWVRFPNSQELTAVLVGSDELTDLAVLRIPKAVAEPLRLAERPARLGELCFALGSPLGEFPESMSGGIVSGLQRSLPTLAGRDIYDVIQTDCAINPGNSGGPLINAEGQVIGVNTAIRRDAEGIGFAVPAETVAAITRELIEHGEIVRASLGVAVSQRRVDGLGGERRLVITGVRDTVAGPLDRNDVIVRVANHEVRTRQDLIRTLNRDLVDAQVDVTVWRDGSSHAIPCRPQRLHNFH